MFLGEATIGGRLYRPTLILRILLGTTSLRNKVAEWHTFIYPKCVPCCFVYSIGVGSHWRQICALSFRWHSYQNIRDCGLWDSSPVYLHFLEMQNWVPNCPVVDVCLLLRIQSSRTTNVTGLLISIHFLYNICKNVTFEKLGVGGGRLWWRGRGDALSPWLGSYWEPEW
jgi:hypothetical protein